jgi:hypothetical protein
MVKGRVRKLKNPTKSGGWYTVDHFTRVEQPFTIHMPNAPYNHFNSEDRREGEEQSLKSILLASIMMLTLLNHSINQHKEAK